MISTISINSVIVATQDQVVSVELAGEAVILNLNSGVYYGLDPIGAQIWEMIKKPLSVCDLRNILLEEYDVEPKQCEQDLLVLLEQMADNGLVEVMHGVAS